MKKDKNIIIEDFGNEWEKFDQINLINEELDEIFNDYFDIFPRIFPRMCQVFFF